jgi:uncharacterized protein YbbK (DUF523 family)
MKIVSACLAGLNVRYDGKNKANEKVIQMVKDGKAIPLCPEQLAGFPTSREPMEIREGRVVTRSGKDVTEKMQRAAQDFLEIAKHFNVKEVIFKSKSPSCGKGLIYDGTFSGKLVKGNGIFTELLQKNGIKVLTEEELPTK